jgi:tight adherence protein C
MVISPIVAVTAGGGFAAILLLSGVFLIYSERRVRTARVRGAVGKRTHRNVSDPRSVQNQAWRKGAVSFMRTSTTGLSLIKGRHAKEAKALLISAGYRSRDAIVVYTFFKLVTPLVFVAGAALYIYGLNPIGKGPMFDAAAVMAAGLLGSRLPEVFLNRKKTARMEVIRKALPDSLDMLVICAEAGLASDSALKRVVAETGRNASVLSDELNLTAIELSFLPERRQALDNFAERAPLPSVQAFVNTLTQAEKYGTPLARAFKTLSEEQRSERMLRAEEKAGRLPATMTVPMMLFILPALFIVLLGPAVLDILDNFIGKFG